MSKGIYTLLISLDKPQVITIGKLGKVLFSDGYYVYVGSALNSLEPRIAIHLKKRRRSTGISIIFYKKPG